MTSTAQRRGCSMRWPPATMRKSRRRQTTSPAFNVGPDASASGRTRAGSGLVDAPGRRRLSWVVGRLQRERDKLMTDEGFDRVSARAISSLRSWSRSRSTARRGTGGRRWRCGTTRRQDRRGATAGRDRPTSRRSRPTAGRWTPATSSAGWSRRRGRTTSCAWRCRRGECAPAAGGARCCLESGGSA